MTNRAPKGQNKNAAVGDVVESDQDGAVSVETDGTTVRVRTFNGRKLTLRTNGR